VKIIKADEPLLVTNIKMLIYGEPGAGKTSLAFSAKDTLCLDFDNGAHRSAFRKDTVRVTDWAEIANISPADVSDYKTLHVDTVGRLLDMIASHVIRNNRKMSTRAGNLTLQGYGELKAIFSQWVKMVEQLGMDLVFVAHNKEEKDGDSILMRPDIQGSSYHEVFKVADAVGYVRILNRRRTIDFEPTEQHVGKDTARIGLAEIPDLAGTPDYGAQLIQRIKDSINNASEAGRKATEEIDSYRVRLDECIDLDCLNDIRKEIADIKSQLVKDKSKAILIQRMKALNAAWDKEENRFVSLAVEESSGPRDFDWYLNTADNTDKVATWWDNEKENAKRDLNEEDFGKIDSYVKQLGAA
jgi:hypothetical protein